MKILAICQYYYPENFVFTNICEGLKELGNDVTVLTAKPNYGYGEIIPEYRNISYEEINGVKVHRVNIKPRKKTRLSIIRNYLSFWQNSKKWVRKCKEKYDIVYSMSLSPVTILSAGNLYKKKHGVKHVVHCVDLWPESVLVTHAVREHSLTYKFLYKWSRKLYNNADTVLIGSPSFEQYFNDVLKIKKKLEFVPQPSLVENNECEPYNFNNDKFNILYCGNLGIIQLINLIPESMKFVKSNVQFHVIGMGPKSEELRKLISDYHLEDKVIYHGPIPAKKAAAYFQGADALYISLKNDGYVGKTIPNKMMMSMAFGKPILGVLSGDGRTILEECGNVLSDEDPQSIAKAIDYMATLSKDKLKRIGQDNQTYYFKNLSINSCAEKVNKALSDELF